MFYLLLSGDLLFLGLALTLVGLVAAVRFALIGRVLAWAGVSCVVSSSVPIHPFLYGAFCLVAGLWHVGRTRDAVWRVGSTGALVLVAFALGSEGASLRKAVPLDVRSEGVVFVVGDSLSAGLGPSTDGTWPQILARSVNHPIVNLARAGATLARSQQQLDAIPIAPAFVLVELGGNDILSGISSERYEADLRSLLRALAAKGARVAVFELPLLPLQARFGRVQRRVCEDLGTSVLPRFLLAGAIASAGNTVDGLHLSPQGHAWLAQRMAELWPREKQSSGS